MTFFTYWEVVEIIDLIRTRGIKTPEELYGKVLEENIVDPIGFGSKDVLMEKLSKLLTIYQLQDSY